MNVEVGQQIGGERNYITPGQLHSTGFWVPETPVLPTAEGDIGIPEEECSGSPSFLMEMVTK